MPRKNMKSNKKKQVQKKLIRKRNILKGTKTAWIFFCDKNRDKILKENPNLAFGDICKKLAPLWNGLNDDEKKPYVEMHLKDKLRYETRLKNLTEDEKKQLRKYKRYQRSLKKNKPKTALSPYMFFVIEKRSDVVAKHPEADFKMVGKLLGQLWNGMSDCEKQVYFDKSKADRERYIREKTTCSKKKD